MKPQTKTPHYKIEGYSETDIYYQMFGELYMIKAINSVPEEHDTIITNFHDIEGVLVTLENVPANCPFHIAFNWFSGV